MQNKDEQRSSFEQQLIQYIDIPYFKNNPTYIKRWREYYEKNKDPQILLLMYHKNISTFYHWIYIEMSNHFIKLNKAEISSFILNEALKNRVYDEKKIKEALSQLPAFSKKYNKGDMICLLNQRNIQALGKLWNSYTEVYSYKKILKDIKGIKF